MTVESPAFTFKQDWDRYDGGLVWENAKTLKRYRELSRQHAPAKGWFAAFNNEQFAEGLNGLVEKGEAESKADIKSFGAGIYGTPDGLKGMMDFYYERDKRIADECDPQEVYCEEFNNHECMIDYDGDIAAMLFCIGIFGVERCKRIKRVNAFYSFEHIAKEA